MDEHAGLPGRRITTSQPTRFCPSFEGPCLFVFWHEYIPFMFYLRGHCQVAFLVSQHRDAQWVSQAARHMGFQTVQGSTTRGGVAALLRILNNRVPNLAITPDGPRGPRHHLAPGAVYLASRLGIPVVPVGLGYDRPWRVRKSWDQFAIPRPYSRARAIFAPRVVVPDGLSRDRLDAYSRRIEAMLNRLTETAEQWAESGCRMTPQRPLPRRHPDSPPPRSLTLRVECNLKGSTQGANRPWRAPTRLPAN